MYCALLLFLAAWILREEVNQYLEHPANEFHRNPHIKVRFLEVLSHEAQK